MNITIKGYECDVVFRNYYNGNIAIQLIGKIGTDYEGEIITTATVNGELRLENDIVGIKTWSENEGIVKSLVDGGVIESGVLGVEPTGFVAIEHYRLTAESLNKLKQSEEE